MHFRDVTITSTWELRKLTLNLNNYLYREMSSSVELAQWFWRKRLKCEEVRRSGQLTDRTLTLGLFFKIIPYFLQLVAILYVYVKRYTSVHYSTGWGGGTHFVLSCDLQMTYNPLHCYVNPSQLHIFDLIWHQIKLYLTGGLTIFYTQ